MDYEFEPADLLFPVAQVIARATARYLPDVQWTAPRRGLSIRGRDALVALLCSEAAAMHGAQLQPLRTARTGAGLVEESSIRFVYAGTGIAGLPLAAGARVELGRVRLITLRHGRIAEEACIETWSALPAADGSPGYRPMALPERFDSAR
jgi:hypothetical protein